MKLEVVPVSKSQSSDVRLVQEITDLANQVYRVAEDGIWAPNSSRTTPEEITNQIAAEEIVIAKSGDALVGCIRIQRLSDETSEFGLLTSHPDYRNAGIGRALVDFAEDFSRSRGAKEMQLELLVPKTWKHPSKEFLKSWYTRKGYKLVTQADFAEAYPNLVNMLATSCDFLIFKKNLLQRT